MTGRYLPTEKNKLVEDPYAKLGFTLLERRDDGSADRRLDIDEAAAVAPLIAMGARAPSWPRWLWSPPLAPGVARRSLERAPGCALLPECGADCMMASL